MVRPTRCSRSATARRFERAIPGAELLVLEKTGHELPPPVWDEFVPALVRHSAACSA